MSSDNDTFLIAKIAGQRDEAEERAGKFSREAELHRKRAHDLQEKLTLAMAVHGKLKDEHMRLSVVTSTLLRSYSGLVGIMMQTNHLTDNEKLQLKATFEKFKLACGVEDKPETKEKPDEIPGEEARRPALE